MERQFCIVCGGVLLEWGRGKGELNLGREKVPCCPRFRLLLSLDEEMWAQQGCEQEALRVYGKTDSGEDKGF